MSQHPAFNGSPFATNTNQLPFNFNQNVNIPSHVSPFQQTASMSFLSFPPPSLPGSHHVFINGPRFPGVMNATQPSVFAANAPGNPSMMTSPAFATNLPNGNMISHSPFASTPSLAALTSVPPPQGSPMWNPTPFDHMQSPPPNFSNGVTNFRNAGNFQQTPQKFNAQNINPWSSNSSNNFQNPTNETISPWAVDPSKANNGFNSFQSGNNTSSPSVFQNSISPWASNSNSNFSNSFQGTPVHSKESPSNFRQSKSPASDINPWAQPPSIVAGSQIDNYQFSNKQHNFNANKFNEPNFNNRRGNSRFFSYNNQNRNNYKRQERNFKAEGDFKRESNESKPYSCDTCDRAFASEVEFRDHMNDHIKCNFKNCTFEAHPKIVSLHKRMQHDTGYADAINKLKNDDEIEKWRAERRRHFPTAANILKRKAEQAEKEARGEVIENQEFGKFKRQNTGQREQKNNRIVNRKRGKNKNRNNRFDASSATVTVSDSDSDSDDDSHIKLRKFSGIFAVADASNIIPEKSGPVHNSPEKLEEQIENDTSESSKDEHLDTHLQEESEENQESTVKTMDEPIKGMVSSNPINIESDDDAPIEFKIVNKQSSFNEDKESEDESPIEMPVSKVPLDEIPNSPCEVAKDLPPIISQKVDTESDDDAPVEIPVSKVPLNEISNPESVVANSRSPVDEKKGSTEVKDGKNSSKAEPYRRNSNRKNEPHYVNHVRKSSLLEKLLADDIRHERNVIMQCIRHIVKKKFFGIGLDA